MTNEELAQLLRKMREDAGLKQWQVAERLGVTRASVTHYESCSRRPSLEVIQEWARICDRRIGIVAMSAADEALTVTEEEETMIRGIRSLPPERRRLIGFAILTIQRVNEMALPILAAQLEALHRATGQTVMLDT